MILPSKRLPQDWALLTIGSVLLKNLPQSITISALWEQVSRPSKNQTATSDLRCDTFILALSECHKMILPSKHLPQDRALLTIGAVLLQNLSRSITVSALWEQVSRPSKNHTAAAALRYDTFVLALDLLFLMGAIDLREGLLVRRLS